MIIKNIYSLTLNLDKMKTIIVANLLVVQDEIGFETMFKGDDYVEEFTSWLLDGIHQGAIAIAHNLRGNDGFLLCKYFYKKLLLPKLILNRAKIMSMELEEAEIKFCDSHNFLPISLKALKNLWSCRTKEGLLPSLFQLKRCSHYAKHVQRTYSNLPAKTVTLIMYCAGHGAL